VIHDPEDEDAWVNYWVAAGRAKMRELEAAIMALDAPEDERLDALERFRASAREAARSLRGARGR
jgi:F0F1-type ATP synthase epsilon subunit